MDPSILLAILAGVAVAASAGLRAFLPLLAIGLAARLGVVTLADRVAWLSGDIALVCLGVATVVEIVGDKIPVVDHALDVVGTVLRPLAATLGAYALFVDVPAPWAPIVAMVLGAGTLGLHLLKAHVRLGSTALTLGAGNPVLSTAEDAVAGTLVVTAILAPIAALVVILAIILWWRRGRRRRAEAPGAAGRGPTAP